MIIDVHTHIFPPDIISGKELFLAGEPEFALLYAPAASKMASAEILIQSMDENNIDFSVVFGFPWRNAQTLARHNDYVLEAAARYPDRLIPLACIDLCSPTCAAQAEKMLCAGARGLGELAVYCAGENMDRVIDNFKQIGALCRQKEAVLLLHANEPIGHQYPGKAPHGLAFYYAMAKAAQGATLIFAHWGGGLIFYELLKKQAPATFANIYYDTAASPYVYKTVIYSTAARAVGAGRILFGSDYPLLSPKRYFCEMEQAGLEQKEIDAIAGQNAAAIFKIAPA
ncbi:MAG: amidohydrolase family protein [Syntrophobacteraceae bacterium]